MPQRLPLSIVIITLNEAENIERSLKSVEWAREILVVDCGSQDKTCEIAQKLGAKVLFHAWEGYGQQKNWARSQASEDWILYLDADEEVSLELKSEIEAFLESVNRGEAWAGMRLPRRTFYLGRWIRYGGWYPNALLRLAGRVNGVWTEPPLHESLEVKGKIWEAKKDLYHYTFKDMGEQVATNIRYAKMGAISSYRRGERGSIFSILTKPATKFFETYFWKLGFLDGLPGFVISINAAHSQFMRYVELRFGNFEK